MAEEAEIEASESEDGEQNVLVDDGDQTEYEE